MQDENVFLLNTTKENLIWFIIPCFVLIAGVVMVIRKPISIWEIMLLGFLIVLFVSQAFAKQCKVSIDGKYIYIHSCIFKNRISKILIDDISAIIVRGQTSPMSSDYFEIICNGDKEYIFTFFCSEKKMDRFVQNLKVNLILDIKYIPKWQVFK